MAHFAELNKDDIVLRVIVVNNEKIVNTNNIEEESIGIDFCQSLFGSDTRWVQTSYNNNFRKRYAGISYKYNEEYDAFIEPKPYTSWLFDENDLSWIAPKPQPNDDNNYVWDEETISWIQV
jgi:hypothetical protein